MAQAAEGFIVFLGCDSGGRSVIVIQRAAQTFTALHLAPVREMNWVRLNQLVVQT